MKFPASIFNSKKQLMLMAWLLSGIFPSITQAKDDLPVTFVAAKVILEKHCVSCHNYGEKKGELVLDRGPIKLDDPAELIKLVSGSDPEMPKKGKTPQRGRNRRA